MNYLYGKLVPMSSSASYEGLTTETAEVIVDNSARTIKVNAIVDTEPVEDSEKLITSGGVYAAIANSIGDIESILTSLDSGEGV